MNLPCVIKLKVPAKNKCAELTRKNPNLAFIFLFSLSTSFYLIFYLCVILYHNKKKTGLVPYYMGQPTDYSMEEHQV